MVGSSGGHGRGQDVDPLVDPGPSDRLRAEDGLAILLVEQYAPIALAFADSALVLDRGRIVYNGDGKPLLDDPERLAALFGVAG